MLAARVGAVKKVRVLLAAAACLAVPALLPAPAATAHDRTELGVRTSRHQSAPLQARTANRPAMPRHAAANLEPCDEAPGGLCGRLEVPLDHARPAAGTVSLFFEYFPHTDTSRQALEPIFATEGGPGYSITQNERESYVSFLLAPLRDRHDVVLIDQRGVGLSDAIDCKPFQHATEDPYTGAAECGAQLGAAASLYGSADVARDIDAVRAALHVQRLDLYGASYAAVDVQAYAFRFPHRLRAVVLDSPVPATDFDPWNTSTAGAIQRSVRLLCARSASCSADHPDGAAELSWLARRLRQRPVDGVGYDAAAVAHTLHVTESFLAAHIGPNANGGFVAASELPAAARALRHGDPLPLLRLAADSDSSPFEDAGDPSHFSAGESLARFCTDNRFQWDRNAPIAERRAQWVSARDALPRDRFAPFSVEAWAVTDNFNPDPCIAWPAPSRHLEPPVPPGARFPNLPALILAGDLDTFVPLEDNRRVADQFPNRRFVTIANTGHHTAFHSPDGCSAAIIQQFLATLETGDLRCATRLGFAFPAVGRFPVLARQARPAVKDTTATDRSRRGDRKVAAVAAAAVTDAFRRTFLSGAPAGVGLRGGTIQAAFGDTGATVDLSAARAATDVSVSGHAIRPWDSEAIDATIQVDGPGGHDGNLRIAGVWFAPGATTLTLRGTLGGRRVSLQVPAT
jgi:pimeloyl-ACP methyl ester carboxylesterase